MKKTIILLTLIACCIACTGNRKKNYSMTNETLVRLETTMGDITVKLYDETPKHRDNFIKLVKEGVYDSTLFHRVIQNFMIQAGDPTSKTANDTAKLGSGDVGKIGKRRCRIYNPSRICPDALSQTWRISSSTPTGQCQPRTGFIGMPILYCDRTSVQRRPAYRHGKEHEPSTPRHHIPKLGTQAHERNLQDAQSR